MTTDIVPEIPETGPDYPLFLAGTLKAFCGDYARSDEVAALVMESAVGEPIPGTWQEAYLWLANVAREADERLRNEVPGDTLETSP